MAKGVFTTAVLASALTAGAFLLNPTPEQHQAKIRAAVAEHQPLAGALGLGLLKSWTAQYHSIGIASYTTDETHLLSVGALSMVWALKPAASSAP